jgi:DNA-directed RNA polymerase subunit RPC12/RpoP
MSKEISNVDPFATLVCEKCSATFEPSSRWTTCNCGGKLFTKKIQADQVVLKKQSFDDYMKERYPQFYKGK